MKNLKPITRREMFMAKAAGQDVTPPEPITREEMFLSDIAEHEEGQSGGSGGGLPAVTSDDNGDVLTVVEGVWAKAQPSGGGVVATMDAQTQTLDKTWKEIRDALVAGKTVVINIQQTQEGVEFYETVTSCSKNGSEMNLYTYNCNFRADSENGYPVFYSI